MSGFPYRIVAEWSDEDDAYVARVPALPNCAAHGDSMAEATAEAQTAAEGILEALGKKAPPPDRAEEFSGNIRLRLPRFLHAALSRRATAEGVSLNSLMTAILAAARSGESDLVALEERLSRSVKPERKESLDTRIMDALFGDDEAKAEVVVRGKGGTTHRRRPTKSAG